MPFAINESVLQVKENRHTSELIIWHTSGES